MSSHSESGVATKKLFNDKEATVDESLLGFVSVNPNLLLLKVCILSYFYD